jgi:two-component system NtrC family sensor kinase
MTIHLKGKFIFWSTMLLALILVLGGSSIWNLVAQWRTTRAASAEYDAMDRADAASVQVAWLRDALRGSDGRTYRDLKYFGHIQSEVQQIERELKWAAGVDDGDARAEADLAQSAASHLDSAIERSASAAVATATEAATELDRLHQTLIKISDLIPSAARRHVAATTDHLRHRLQWTCILLLIVLIISAAIHYRQYRALVRPLLWLRDDMRHSAAREYREPVRQRGDREFIDVAGYFNGLAKELANLYRDLEQKVITRSRELVRSERLASVGFLAAGVAHEINNPLSVISGYAELAAKSLRDVLMGGDFHGAESQAQAEAEALASALEAQTIIREEAFRCKEITSRLLSLARGGGDGRQTLSMDEVARQVTVLTKGLKNYRDRRVVLDFTHADPLEVLANPTEMKQVLLNLTVNALEAVPAGRGEVRIGGRREGQWVELSIEDNGKGMSTETLEHVFEPFFTAKRGAGEPGTGLGLSITHTIIENHGGRIRAESRGPGTGSRFTVRLPASARAVAVANQG